MVTILKTYNSIEEIAETLDQQIGDTKSSLGEYLRQLDEIRSLAEKTRKVRETVLKLTGKKNGSADLGEIDVGGMKVVLEANAFQQLTAIESAVRSHQDRLLALQRAREGLTPLNAIGNTEGLTFMILEKDGIPERILVKVT